MPKKHIVIVQIYRKIVKMLSGHGLKKYYPVMILNNFVKSKLKNDFAIVQGHKMYLDQKDNLSLSIFGVYEPLETELVKNEIKKDNVVLDIGAFIGYYTLIFAKLVGDQGKVFAFEPDSKSFDLLKKNVQLNGYKNVILEQKAVSNKNEKKIEVENICLDDYFKDYDGKIDFIKIDIEGAEKLALDGMSTLLHKNKDIKLMTEFHPVELKKSTVEPSDYLKTLNDYGFKIYHINNKENKIELISNEELLRIYPERDSLTNIFCKRE